MTALWLQHRALWRPGGTAGVHLIERIAWSDLDLRRRHRPLREPSFEGLPSPALLATRGHEMFDAREAVADFLGAGKLLAPDDQHRRAGVVEDAQPLARG